MSLGRLSVLTPYSSPLLYYSLSVRQLFPVPSLLAPNWLSLDPSSKFPVEGILFGVAWVKYLALSLSVWPRGWCPLDKHGS